MRALMALLLAGSLGFAAPPERKREIRVPVWFGVDSETSSPAAPGELSVSVAGVRAQPNAILGPGDDLMLLIVTDLTGDLSLAEEAKKALGTNLDRLPPNALVSVLRAQDGLSVLVDPTADRDPVKEAIDGLPVSGRAALLGAVEPVSRLGDAILSKARVRVAALFVTDSDINNYREDLTNPTINYSDERDISRRFQDSLIRERISKLEAALAARETPLFIVHLERRSDALNQAYQTGLITLAAATGGAAYFCHSRTEIPEIIARAFLAIATHHSITVPVPAGAPRVIEVVIECPGRPASGRTRFATFH